MTTLEDRTARSPGTLTSDPTDAKGGAGKGKKAKKSKKRLIIVVLVVALVGAGAYEFLLAPKPAATAGTATPAPLPGVLVPTDAVTVNLTEGHYLRISVAMQFTSKVSATTPPDTAAALDQMITYLTGMSADRLNTSLGLAAVKTALTTRISGAYPKDPLLELLITSYVIQ
jgi:flagellar protein FliL